MQALNKTKATMQGRQCRLTFLQLSGQDITAAGHVNNYGKNPVFMGVANNFCSVSVLTFLPAGGGGRFPQIEVIREIKCLQINAPAIPHIRGGVQSFGKAAGIELQICNSGAQTPDLALAHFFSSLLETAEAKPADNARVISFGFRLVGLISRCRWRKLRIIFSEMKPPERPELSLLSTGGSSSSNGQRFNGHPFGSIPALRNFALPNSLSQLARLTPSAFACCSNCSFSSGLMRIRNCGDCPSPFGLLSRLIVDKWSPILIRLILLGGHLNTVGSIKTTPRSARNTYRASDQKPLIGVTVMAEQQHTQTRPKYQYRFMALDRADMAAKPCRLSVEAETEQDARRILAPHFILSLAARLPVVEVSHA